MKSNEVVLLRERIAAALADGRTPSAIARDLQCSRSAVYTVHRLLTDADATLTDGRQDNQGRPPLYSDEIWTLVLKERKDDPRCGPVMLHHRLMRKASELGYDTDDIPSPSAIAIAIREAGLANKPIGPKDKRLFPVDKAITPGLFTIDCWGPWEIRATRIYLVTIQDRFTRLACAYPLVSTPATVRNNTILPTSIAWARAVLGMKRLLLPADGTLRAVFTDNGVGMVPAMCTLPQGARAGLAEGAEVVYIPPAQPWRNG